MDHVGVRTNVFCLTFDVPLEGGEEEEEEGKRGYAPRCVCLSSFLPIYDFAKLYLRELYIRMHSLIDTDIPLESHICNIVLDAPLPPPGISLRIRLPSYSDDGSPKYTKFSVPPPKDFSFCEARYLFFFNFLFFFSLLIIVYISSRILIKVFLFKVSLRTLFLCLDNANFLKLFTAVLLENHILLVSRSNALLATAAEALVTLMYPFTWHHVYIPVLPHSLPEFVEGITPFIIGINSENFSKLSELTNVTNFKS
jgi:hypothetical protein